MNKDLHVLSLVKYYFVINKNMILKKKNHKINLLHLSLKLNLKNPYRIKPVYKDVKEI